MSEPTQTCQLCRRVEIVRWTRIPAGHRQIDSLRTGLTGGDPDEALQALRKGIRRLRDAACGDSNDREIELGHELADAAEALDNWMSSGGFLPADWAGRETS